MTFTKSEIIVYALFAFLVIYIIICGQMRFTKILYDNTDYDVLITDYDIIEDQEDNLCLVLYVTWSNYSEEPNTYWRTVKPYAYENLKSLKNIRPDLSEHNYLLDLYVNQDKEVNPGNSISTVDFFLLGNNKDKHSIKIKFLNRLANEKTIVKYNKINVERILD